MNSEIRYNQGMTDGTTAEMGTPAGVVRHVRELGILEPQVDLKSGLIFETDDVRQALIQEFTQQLKAGHNVATIQGDLDQLKTLNDKYSRAVGDKGLAWTARALEDSVTKAGLHPDTRVYIFRKKSTGDEMVMWFFNVDRADQPKLAKIKEDLNALREQDESGAHFSVSVGLVQNDGLYAPLQDFEDAKDLVQKGKISTASNLFQELEERADAVAVFTKSLRQIRELSESNIFAERNVRNLIDLAVDEFGGQRITPTIQHIITRTVSVASAINFLRESVDTATFEATLVKKGIDPNDLENVKEPSDILHLFNKLFPAEEMSPAKAHSASE